MKKTNILLLVIFISNFVFAQSIDRPQTPKPPFNYSVDSVEYDNADKTVHYGATLTKPNNKKDFPTVIIISGSGAQDRDGTLFEHKLYWVLADYLTKNGIAVLRVDDRGKGKSSLGSNPKELTSADFSYDVEASLNYLLSRADIKKNKIGLIGHSEGGIIAPMVAARRKEVSFVVLWGAPVIGGAETNTSQNLFLLKKAGIDSNACVQFATLHKTVLSLYRSSTKENLPKRIDSVFAQWRGTLTPQQSKALYVTENTVVGQPVQSIYMGLYNIPWMRYFISYDPSSDLRKLDIPVLAINGSKDTQVSADENLQLIESILKATGNKKLTTKKLEGLNHLLQTAITGDDKEYATIAETMAPTALSYITNWIQKQ